MHDYLQHIQWIECSVDLQGNMGMQMYPKIQCYKDIISNLHQKAPNGRTGRKVRQLSSAMHPCRGCQDLCPGWMDCTTVLGCFQKSGVTSQTWVWSSEAQMLLERCTVLEFNSMWDEEFQLCVGGFKSRFYGCWIITKPRKSALIRS